MNKQKLLIVDDKEENLFSLERILTPIPNLEIIKTTKPEAALRLCLEHDFSLAILDVQMPGMDGYEMAELLRGAERTAELPIIFLSAMSIQDHQIARGYEIGASDYIVKPVRAEVITAKVKVFLELDNGRRNLQQLVESRTRELAESEARFRGTFENAAIGIAHVSAEGNFLCVNQHLCEMLDYSKAELEAKTFQEITHPEDLNKDLDLFAELKSGEIETYTIEKRYFHRDGHIVWILLTTAIERDPQGEFEYCISLIRDITEMKEIERALEIERSRTILTAETVGLGVFDWDLKTNEVYYSKIWKEQLGYAPEELKGTYTTFKDLLHPEDADAVLKSLESALSHSAIWTESFRLRHKNGSYRWISSHGLLVRNEKGNALRMIGGHLDLTEDRERADAYKKAMEKANASNKAKSQFLANMSHELRTPLNPILGFSELLMNEDSHNLEDVNKLASIIYQSGQHMLSLIEEVLDFSRLQSGKSKVEMESCALKTPFTEVESILRTQAEKKGLVFDTEIDLPSEPAVCCPKILRQISFNLLSNAIKFTEKGHVKFEVAVEQSDLGSSTLKITVEDTGIGIPIKDQKRIFAPFEQVDSSISRKYSGTGLGLAITQKQIELLSGNMQLESVEGEGTRFQVSIPIEIPQTQSKAENTLDQNESNGVSEAPGSQSMRIMVVEDDVPNKLVMQKMLKVLGHQSFIFSNAQEAIDNLQNGEDYDLIFMDLKMPGLNGYEATKQILKIDSCKHMPIFAITANVTADAKKKCKEIGMVGFLSKPLKLNDLRSALAAYQAKMLEVS